MNIELSSNSGMARPRLLAYLGRRAFQRRRPRRGGIAMDRGSRGCIRRPASIRAHIESAHYVGYVHHRWIFTLVPGELRLISKWPFASYFSPRRASLLRLKAGAL